MDLFRLHLCQLASRLQSPTRLVFLLIFVLCIPIVSLTQRFIVSFAAPNVLNNILLVLFLYDALGDVLHGQSPVVLTFIFNVTLVMG